MLDVTYDNLAGCWKSLLCRLQLPPTHAVLYQLRHSGPSHDRFTRHRSLAEVKQRSRWAADSSVRRYEAHARINQEFLSLDPKLQKTSPAGRREASTAGPKAFWPKVSKFAQPKYVLEIFSGCARMSQAMSKQGFTCFAYDIEYNSGCDLLNFDNRKKLVKWINKHSDQIALIWFGTPCTSWSRARRFDGGPPPLRDDGVHLMLGCEHLSARDQAKVLEGNALLDVTIELIKLCQALQLPWVMENPYTSRIWLTPQVQKLCAYGAILHQVDYCAFGTPWRKSTGLLQYGFTTLQSVLAVCHPTFGRCSFSGHRHLSLTGKDCNNQWMTRRAQPYPLALCERIASALVTHVEHK